MKHIEILNGNKMMNAFTFIGRVSGSNRHIANNKRGLLSVLVAGLSLATCAIASANVSCNWQFGTAANPALPTASSGLTGAAQASITTGQYSDGWIATNAVLGAAQGVWDLGKSGTILLNNPSGLADPSELERVITVSVIQYQDGGIYGTLANVSISGAALINSNASTVAPAYIGAWTRAQTQWRAPAGLTVNSVLVSGVPNGTLVDSITLDSSFVSAPPPQLAIRKAGTNDSQVEVSWPASYTNMVLEASSDTGSSQSWAAVQAQVQVNGNTRYVLLDAIGTARFYRLRQP